MPVNASPKKGRKTKEEQSKLRDELFNNWFGKGLSAKAIGLELGIDEETVRNYQKEWFEKLEQNQDFIETQFRAKQELIAVYENHIHEIFKFRKKLEGMRKKKLNPRLESTILNLGASISHYQGLRAEIMMRPTIQENIADQLRKAMARNIEKIKVEVGKQQKEAT